MQTKQTKTFQVKEPIDKVWRFLRDPRKVAPCLPGAQITEAIDDRTFKGTITVKIGPVSTQFKGTVKLERLDEEKYEMELTGSGQDPRGGGGANMKMLGRLTALPDGGTEVAGTIEATVMGRLAQFGARMMDDVSNHLFNQFTKSFQAKLAEEPELTQQPPTPNATAEPAGSNKEESGDAQSATAPAAEPEPIRALPLLFSVVKNSIARLFRKT